MGTPVDPALKVRGVGANKGGLDAFGEMIPPAASEEGARWVEGRTGDVPLDGCGEWALRGVLAPLPLWVAGEGSRGSAWGRGGGRSTAAGRQSLLERSVKVEADLPSWAPGGTSVMLTER
jgi:hypothetical protein